MIPARDGAKVPVSIVYAARTSRRTARAGSSSTPMAPTAIAIPPGFSTNRLSLLDRGYAFAIAHIRGGDELGYRWYLDGKLEQRTNTFNDFVDAATRPDRAGLCQAPAAIAIQGGSAGGELMGAVVNQAPELWGAVVADVPFVDVLNTMLDDTPAAHPGRVERMGQSDHRRGRVPATSGATAPTTMSRPRPIRRC